MAQTPSFVQNPIWDTVTVQAQDAFGNFNPQSIPILPQSQFNSFIRAIQNTLQTVSGAGGNQATIQGPLAVNGPITGVSNSFPPAADEALSAGAAASLYNTLRQTVKTVTKSYSIQPTDGTILVDATAGPVVLTLPDATTVEGYIWPVMKIDSISNAVSYATVKGQTVSGSVTSTTTQWGRLWVQSDGSNFWIVSY